MINKWLKNHCPMKNKVEWIRNGSLTEDHESWVNNFWDYPPTGGKHGYFVLLTHIYHLINLMILQYHDFTDPLSLINVPLSDSPRL